LATWLTDHLSAIPRVLPRIAIVLVPNHRLAHQIRRDAILAGDPGRVIGGRFQRLAEVARDVLALAGPAGVEGLRDLPLVTLRALLTSGRGAALGLRYLKPESMEAGRGWADALSATIGDLESAGLTADALDVAARDGEGKLAARLADLAALW